MELSPKQQLIEQIKKSERILITAHVRPDGDAIGSTTAIYQVLKKMGKNVTAVLLEMPKTFSFLPGTGAVAKEIFGTRDFIISLDQKESRVAKVGYNVENNRLNILITPESGKFRPENVSFGDGAFQFDLIIILDCPDFDQLGSLYENSPTLFLETPTINIDHHATNEYYGTINLVELAATSTCEVLVGIIEALGKEYLDENVATCLLTGIITDTGSFQNANTTPKSFTVAAQLVAAGGRQQEIIKYVFKTKPLSTLKLWGRALDNLQAISELKLVWSGLSRDDFEESGAAEEEVSGVIDELLKTAEGAEVVVLLSERSGGLTTGSIRTIKGIDAAAIASLFGGGGHPGAAGFKIKTDFDDAKKQVIEKISNWQRKRISGEKVEPKQEKPAPIQRESIMEKTKEIPPVVPARKEEPVITPEKETEGALDDLEYSPTIPDSEQDAPIIIEEAAAARSAADSAIIKPTVIQAKIENNQQINKYPTLKKMLDGEEAKKARKKQFRPPHL